MKIDKIGTPQECVSTKYTAVCDNIKMHWSPIKLGRYKNNEAKRGKRKETLDHSKDVTMEIGETEEGGDTPDPKITDPPIVDLSLPSPMDTTDEENITPTVNDYSTTMVGTEHKYDISMEQEPSETVSHDDATVVGTNKKEKTETKGLFLDLQVMLPAVKMDPNTKKAEQSSLTLLANRLREWFDEIQSVEPSFRLLNVDPKDDEPGLLHLSKNLNWDKLTEIKRFFRGVRPRKDGGRVYTRIRASFHGTPNDLLANVGWFHQERKEYFAVASLQCFQSAVIGFLLYTLRHTDPEPLMESMKTLCDKPVSMRWMRISDGAKYNPNRDTTEDPRALHIECAQEDLDEVKETARTLWGSSVTQFPLGTQYRFVAQRTSLLDTESITKFEKLLNRQAAWTAQHRGIMREDIYGIDSVIPATTTTLRQALMNIKATSGTTTTPLIYAIDRRWNRTGYNFSFHPDKYDEGCRKVKGLVPILLSQYAEEQIRGFFSPRAMIEGKQLEYNSLTGTVTSADDRELASLLGTEDEMASLQAYNNQADNSTDGAHTTFGNRMGITLTKERTPDNDSVSTLGGGSKRASRPSVFNFALGMGQTHTNNPTPTGETFTAMHRGASTHSDNQSTSTTSSLSLGSKYTMHTRISDIESKFSNMNSTVANVENNMQTINAKMDSLTSLLHSLVQSNSNPPRTGGINQAPAGITLPEGVHHKSGTDAVITHSSDPEAG